MTIPELFPARILAVDDVSENLIILERMLARAGYREVRTLNDSREVVAQCREWQPDLLLLDLRMPELDGFEVMAQLRAAAITPALPILVLTADSDEQTRLRALESGARDFLAKPIDRPELLARVSNLLEARRLRSYVDDLQGQQSGSGAAREEALFASNRQLFAALGDTVHRLARMSEYRDDPTGLHVTRVSLYAARLGAAAGLNDEQCTLLKFASTMHDIGKIGVPDSILLKPGPLDEAEFETMRKHSLLGAMVLANSNDELLRMAEQIALTHHERWDGAGYPNGLVGDEIPLVGRIVALCDAFDALTSVRPYKSAWSPQAALAEIEGNAAKQFDPELVRCLRAELPAVIRIYAAHQTVMEPPAALEVLDSTRLVLAVDDDPAVLNLIEIFLKREGFQVVKCEQGAQAIALARQQRPIAITLDVQMPDLDGWSVLDALKGDPTTADIPVIMLTMSEERGMAYWFGALDYLSKPINGQELIAAIRKATAPRSGAVA